MNKNKKTTKFFARNRRAGGFTLIELVVTIAILGILAGVAIPVYNGYIKKASQAADEQLLAAVNSAAAAAVLEARGVDMAKLGDGALTATKDAPITVNDAAEAKVATAFEKYFAGNGSASFKYYSGLEFKDGVFRGVLNGVAEAIKWGKKYLEAEDAYAFTYDGKTVTVKGDDLEKINRAAFMNDITALTESIDGVVGAAASVLNSGDASIAGFNRWLSDNDINATTPDQRAKALVLYTAQKTKEKTNTKTAAGIVEDVLYTTFADDFQRHINAADKTDAVVDAAMAYAMVESFVNTEKGQTATITDAEGKTVSVKDYLQGVTGNLGSNGGGAAELTAVLNMMKNLYDNSGEFYEYLDGGSATTDLDGYLSAMNAINDNIGNIDMTTYLDQDQGGMSGDYMKALVNAFKADAN